MTATSNVQIDPEFDILIRATEQIKYPALPDLGGLRVTVGKRQFPSSFVSSKITPFRFKVTCTDDALEFHKTDFGNIGDTAPIFRAVATNERIELDGGFLRQTTILDNRWVAKVLFRTRNHHLADGDAAAIVWVLVGGPLGIDFLDPIPCPEGVFRPWSGERGLRCTIGGKPALIRQLYDLPQFPKEKSTVLAVVMLGDDQSMHWHRSIRVVLSFIFGMWLDPAFSYRTTADGSMLSLRVDTIHKFQKWSAKPPIQTASRVALKPIGEQLDTMLQSCEALFQQGVRPEVAVAYLMADHDGAEDEIANICSAIDSFAESKLIEKPKRKFIGKKRFKIVKQAIDDFLKDRLPADEQRFRERVGDVLVLARRESSNKKRQMLWTATHIEVGDEENAALDYRDKLSHVGYIPFDFDDDAQWRLLFKRTGLLRTLANRLFLSLLRFTGEVEPYHGKYETKATPVTLNKKGFVSDDEPKSHEESRSERA